MKIFFSFLSLPVLLFLLFRVNRALLLLRYRLQLFGIDGLLSPVFYRVIFIHRLAGFYLRYVQL
ncbi:hypothetical protein V8C44DRAFT_338011 [Trichoderma aethiopicum]